MMRAIKLITIPAAATLLAACGSFSGLDASNEFSCKAAPGVTCQSISGVHQNAAAGNLPFQRTAANGSIENASGSDAKPVYGAIKPDGKVSPRDMNAAYSGMPVRQPPLVLRVWMAPYEDESGDLHDQSYFYTMVHPGKWMIEANRSNISNQYRPIYPLNRQNQTPEVTPEKGPQALMNKPHYENLVDKTDTQ